MRKEEEQILVIPTDSVVSPSWSGVKQEGIENFEALVRAHGQFKARGIPEKWGMENDPTWKQIIPYMVYRRNGSRLFLMQRNSQGHETRLRDKFSLGMEVISIKRI